MRARAPELAVELLGKPSFRAGHEWRWGRKGSLSVVVSGDKAGMWFDHEAGEGGGFADLVGRDLGMARSDANDWIADRIGMRARHQPPGRRADRAAPDVPAPNAPTPPKPQIHAQDGRRDREDVATPAMSRTEDTATRAERIWAAARPAEPDHPYLVAKRTAPLSLRMDAGGRLVVPLQDVEGALHSLEFIATDGTKRFLAGGAKRGHFCVIGAEPAGLADPSKPLLICEGWATAASLHLATGHAVIAAMDAGNLLPVAHALRARFPAADLVLVADNDAKPDRGANPGVEAARKASQAVDARLAVPEAQATPTISSARMEQTRS